MRLYRYRPIQSALAELEDGSFYFADRRELNDPIEGYVKIFFQGDKPAWQGLLKNFVCSLFYALQTKLLMTRHFGGVGENFLHDLRSRVAPINLQHFDRSPLSKIFSELSEKFLREREVQRLAEFYGDARIKCCGKEPEFVLRAVNDDACRLCVQKCKSLGLIADDFDENFFDVAYELSFDELKNFSDAQRRRYVDEVENLNCDVMEAGLMSLKLNPRNLRDSSRELKQHLLRLKFFFPRLYVEQLKEMMYPDGYVVCFSRTPADSAMWGNYADNHRGVCFVYETENFDGHECINFAAKFLPIEPIKYDERTIERNFFDALNHLNFLRAEDWLTGADGAKSFKLDEQSAEDEYYDVYREKFYRKLPAWRHEQEYRIFLPDEFRRYEEKLARKLKYDSHALKGMVFGLLTSLDDKIELIQRLVRLRKSVRDFEFFQAEFDDETQQISVREKFLPINFK